MDRLMVGSNWDPATQMCSGTSSSGAVPETTDHSGHDHGDGHGDGHGDKKDDTSPAKDDTSDETASKSPRACSLMQYSMTALAVVLVA